MQGKRYTEEQIVGIFREIEGRWSRQPQNQERRFIRRI